MDSIKQNLGSYYYARNCNIYSQFKPPIGYLPRGFFGLKIETDYRLLVRLVRAIIDIVYC